MAIIRERGRRVTIGKAIVLSFSVILVAVGCSTTDPCMKYKVKGSAPHEYYVTYDSIQCIGRGKEVIITKKDQTVIQGRYWGIDDGRRPLPVYVILPEHLPQVRDSLKEWVADASGRIIVYGYPSKSVIYEGSANDAAWNAMMQGAKRELYYMTPERVVTPITVAHIDIGPKTLDIPVDSISQVVRRQIIQPDPPGGHVVVGIVFVVSVVTAVLVAGLLLYRS